MGIVSLRDLFTAAEAVLRLDPRGLDVARQILQRPAADQRGNGGRDAVTDRTIALILVGVLAVMLSPISLAAVAADDSSPRRSWRPG